MFSVKNDAVPAEVDETHSHMQPSVVLERLDLARYVARPRILWVKYFF